MEARREITRFAARFRSEPLPARSFGMLRVRRTRFCIFRNLPNSCSKPSRFSSESLMSSLSPPHESGMVLYLLRQIRDFQEREPGLPAVERTAPQWPHMLQRPTACGPPFNNLPLRTGGRPHSVNRKPSRFRPVQRRVKCKVNATSTRRWCGRCSFRTFQSAGGFLTGRPPGAFEVFLPVPASLANVFERGSGLPLGRQTSSQSGGTWSEYNWRGTKVTSG